MSSLKNKIIISTRPLSTNDSIKNYLVEREAVVLDFPMIRIETVELTEKIKIILQQISSYQWIVFTSKNGVDCFFQFLNQLNLNIENLASTKIAVVGKKTSEEVLKNNGKPFLISSGNTSNDLLTELAEKIEPTEKTLLVLGDIAENTLENGLSNVCNITRINVYKTISEDVISTEIIEKIKNNDYEMILFTSPSGFRGFVNIMHKNKITANFKAACIGRTTEKAMLKNNCQPLFVSSKSDGESFIQELEYFFDNIKN
jgi:uroporphyrinogen-III synthase